MAPRGREGAVPTDEKIRQPLSRNGTCAGESCAEARLVIGGDGGLYSFAHFRLVVCRHSGEWRSQGARGNLSSRV
jgi:hypothetical protein